MEQTLRSLYKIQQIDLELDELAAGSGDLPSEIESLEQKLAEIDSAIAASDTALVELRGSRSEGKIELEELRGRSHELNERLRSVRNNKEYDATTNDIASAEQRLGDLTSTMSALDSKEADLLKEKDTLEKQRNEVSDLHSDKKETLESIQSANADELEQLESMRKETVSDIPDDLLEEYTTIRQRYEEAVVGTRKGACAGCYRAITPQTLVELRRNEELFHCEHCGRIIVDEELAGSVEVLD